TNLLPLNPAVFHEFWINIQDNGASPGTHKVSIYVDGSQTPTVFNVTAGTGADVASTDPTSTNYLALGLPSTVQRGAVDIDFFAYKPGVILPAGFNDLLRFVTPPANQAVLEGQTATFSVDVAGTPPYAYQWYKDAVALGDATNATYTTAPL